MVSCVAGAEGSGSQFPTALQAQYSGLNLAALRPQYSVPGMAAHPAFPGQTTGAATSTSTASTAAASAATSATSAAADK